MLVWNYSFLEVIFVKWVMLRISMLVLSDWMMIVVFGFVECLVCSNILVLVFLWLDFSFFMFWCVFFVMVIYRVLFWNFFLIISLVFLGSFFLFRLYIELVIKLYRFFLFLGLVMYLFYCLGIGVWGFLMSILSVLDVFFFDCFLDLIEFFIYWLKMMWMFLYFFVESGDVKKL